MYNLRLKKLGLDLKDQKIIDLLRRNCRFSNAEIGRMVGLSRESVAYRIKQFEKNEIIRKHLAFFNPSRIDLERLAILIKYKFHDEMLIQNFEKHLSSLTCIGYYLSTIGEYDIFIRLITSSVKERNNAIEGIRKILGNNIDLMDITFEKKIRQTESLFHTENVELKSYSRASFEKYFLEKKEDIDTEMDDKDRRILSLIGDNARMPLVEISKKTKISVVTVFDRIKKMIKAGVITGFRSTIYDKNFGLCIHEVLIDIIPEKDNFDKLWKISEKWPFVMSISEQIGMWSFVFGLHLVDREQEKKFIDSIKDVFKEKLLRIVILTQNKKPSIHLELLDKKEKKD